MSPEMSATIFDVTRPYGKRVEVGRSTGVNHTLAVVQPLDDPRVECCGKESTFEGHSVRPLYCQKCGARAWAQKLTEVQYPNHVWLVKPGSLAGFLRSQVAKKAA